MTGEWPARVAVREGSDLFHGASHALAAALGVPLLPPGAVPAVPFVLEYTPNGLTLLREGDRRGVCIDWLEGAAAFRRRQGGAELLVHACGRPGRGWRVLDATAGLGADALVLASAGFAVVAVEQNPVVHALLADALQRAGRDASLQVIAAHIRLHAGHAVAVMQQETFDCIYLDPMFPEREKTAAVRKPMAYLQALLGEAGDGSDLLQQALRSARHRIVVKRPLHAPLLGDREPDMQWKGKAVRFDGYLPCPD